MAKTTLAIKVDVDTDRGTKKGVPNLLALFRELKVPASFLFTLGPDTTGKAIKRVFRPGFFKKVKRTSVVSHYGIKTLMHGTLLPSPHIGRRHDTLMRSVQKAGFEVGIHCYDHIRWQDELHTMTEDEVSEEFRKAKQEFLRVFRRPARTAGAAGWQANTYSLRAYDEAKLLYASDARGSYPFFPKIDGTLFKTLQIPTTMPTLDEILGRDEYKGIALEEAFLKAIQPGKLNVFTIHAELEGMKFIPFLKKFIEQAQDQKVEIVSLPQVATDLLKNKEKIPVCELELGFADGRSGTLAVQGP